MGGLWQPESFFEDCFHCNQRKPGRSKVCLITQSSGMNVKRPYQSSGSCEHLKSQFVMRVDC